MPGMNRAPVDAAVKAGAARAGFIAGVEGWQTSALRRWPPCAAAARARGGRSSRSSRTGGGVVERNIEIDDDRLGFIAADELNPQKARRPPDARG